MNNNIIKENKIDKKIFYICIIDTLFLPYIPVLSIKISLIALIYWFLKMNKNIKIEKNEKMIIFFVFLVIVSVLVSGFSNNLSIWNSNIINSLILIQGMVYLFFYLYYFKYYDQSLKYILIIYIVFSLVLCIVFYISPGNFFKLRNLWSISGNYLNFNVSTLSIITRFGGLLSDPNNAAVIYVAILLYLVFSTKITLNQSVILLAFVGILVFATMSTTGLICYVFAGILSLYQIIKKFVNYKNKVETYLLTFLLIIIFVAVFCTITQTEVYKLVLERASDSTLSTRTDNWLEIIKGINISSVFLLGAGGNIIVNDHIVRPHNGHIFLIYNFGFLAYFIFMYLIFRYRKGSEKKQYSFLLVVFIGFTINVGLLDQRFLFLLVLLVSKYEMSTKYNKEKNDGV